MHSLAYPGADYNMDVIPVLASMAGLVHSSAVKNGHGIAWGNREKGMKSISFSFLTPLAAMFALFTASAAGAEEHVPPRACVAGERSIIVHVSGFKSDVGMVRAQLYGPNPADFLESGKYVSRIERRRDERAEMRFCFPVAAPGRYAVAIRHDANDNGRSDWNDGGGFSRNPSLSVLKMKPDFGNVAVAVGEGPVTVEIVMQYRRGLSIGPVR